MLRRLLILSSLLLWGAQALPSVTIAWVSPDAALLTWSNLPVSACIARDGKPLLETCNVPNGSRVLPRTGGDAAYRAVPNARYQVIVAPGHVVAETWLAPYAPPSLTVSWRPGGAARVAWSSAPAGSCVEAHRPDGRVVLLEPCGHQQTVALAAGGVDAAYAPRGGTVYVLAWHGAALAQATLPRIETALPNVVAP